MITIPMFSELFDTKYANAHLRRDNAHLTRDNAFLRDENMLVRHDWCVTKVKNFHLENKLQEVEQELNNAKLRIASLEADDAKECDNTNKASLTHILNI
jgi:hypothetical protein